MGEFEVMPSLEDRGPSQVVRPLTIRGNGRFRQDGFGGAKHGASERRLLMPLRGAIFLSIQGDMQPSREIRRFG